MHTQYYGMWCEIQFKQCMILFCWQGFVHNLKQHRWAGLAIVEMAQTVQHLWRHMIGTPNHGMFLVQCTSNRVLKLHGKPWKHECVTGTLLFQVWKRPEICTKALKTWNFEGKTWAFQNLMVEIYFLKKIFHSIYLLISQNWWCKPTFGIENYYFNLELTRKMPGIFCQPSFENPV